MRERNMTVGSPIGEIVRFALPAMLGNICQQLYTIVDAAFVGRFAGFQALAAVGTADWLSWLVMGVIWGYAQGFFILIAQRFGADDRTGLPFAVGNSRSLMGLISVLLLLVSQLLTVPLLRVQRTPEDIFPLAENYLRILFAGLPVMGAYNVEASILRGVGDAKTPLIAMAVASFTNIALDALFVISFGWGVAGAAAATVIAQGVSALYCLRVVRGMPSVHCEKRHLKPERKTGRSLIALGTPTALLNTVIGVGGLALQGVINPYGTAFIAGFTATNKLYGLMEMAAISYGSAISAYTGQNFGAKKYSRIRKGVRDGALLSAWTAILISLLLFLFGRPLLSLFISGEEAQRTEVLDIAQRYLNVMLCVLFCLYFLYVFRSALQGMGDTVTPMVSGFVELAMRIGTALILPSFMGRDGLYFAEDAAWIGAMLLLMIGYFYRVRHLPARDEE